MFILWAIHIGITCGCQLYEMAIITSLIVTAVLVILNRINIGSKSHILVIHSKSAEYESVIVEVLKKHTKRYRIKSRNYTQKGMDYIFEIVTKEAAELSRVLEKKSEIERFSLMEYDSDDIL